MIEVDVNKAGGIEKALKTLKRKWNNIGILRELRERKTYKKPSVRRREEILRAEDRERYRQGHD